MVACNLSNTHWPFTALFEAAKKAWHRLAEVPRDGQLPGKKVSSFKLRFSKVLEARDDVGSGVEEGDRQARPLRIQISLLQDELDALKQMESTAFDKRIVFC